MARKATVALTREKSRVSSTRKQYQTERYIQEENLEDDNASQNVKTAEKIRNYDSETKVYLRKGSGNKYDPIKAVREGKKKSRERISAFEPEELKDEDPAIALVEDLSVAPRVYVNLSEQEDEAPTERCQRKPTCRVSSAELVTRNTTNTTTVEDTRISKANRKTTLREIWESQGPSLPKRNVDIKKSFRSLGYLKTVSKRVDCWNPKIQSEQCSFRDEYSTPGKLPQRQPAIECATFRDRSQSPAMDITARSAPKTQRRPGSHGPRTADKTKEHAKKGGSTRKSCVRKVLLDKVRQTESAQCKIQREDSRTRDLEEENQGSSVLFGSVLRPRSREVSGTAKPEQENESGNYGIEKLLEILDEEENGDEYRGADTAEGEERFSLLRSGYHPNNEINDVVELMSASAESTRKTHSEELSILEESRRRIEQRLLSRVQEKESILKNHSSLLLQFIDKCKGVQENMHCPASACGEEIQKRVEIAERNLDFEFEKLLLRLRTDYFRSQENNNRRKV